jgi:hypothetical protein
MTKTPRRQRLKVFQAQLGFFDTVVAAPSQAAALRAWGVHQNLFAENRAQVTTDAAAAKAALGRPGEPLRRPVGSHDAFELAPAGLPTPPEASPPDRKPGRRRPRPPDRERLDRAEARLARLTRDREREEAGFASRQAELDKAREASSRAFERDRRSAQAEVEAASRAYRKAGGRD